MANYTNLYRGTGDTEETRRLQQSLIDRGYDLGTAGADGIYGQQTESAVRQYQSDNSLDVDGIAGEKTLTSLYESPTTQQPVTQPETSTLPGQENGQQTTGGSISQGTYEEQYAQTYEELMGTEGFSYDLNGDPLWQQYKDSYTAQGKLAAMDNMGQAMGMTGGFGSSYAQGVGQQTYQGYLQQMNDRVPELYQLAMQKYDADLALAKDEFYAAGTMADREYEHEQDASDNQKAAYDDLVTRIKNGYTPTDDELTAAGMTRKEYVRIRMNSDPSGGYEVNRNEDGTTNVKSPYTNIVYYEPTVKMAQWYLGLPQTGVWDAMCEAAANEMNLSWGLDNAVELLKEYLKNNGYRYDTELGDFVDSKGQKVDTTSNSPLYPTPEPEYVIPDAGGQEETTFMEYFKDYGEEYATDWAEAHMIAPEIIDSWVRIATFEG